MAEGSQPRFFASSTAFRAWLEAHHGSVGEVWIGFWKKHTGKKGLTYEEAGDQRPCFGRIHGLGRPHREGADQPPFPPRRPRRLWRPTHNPTRPAPSAA